MTAIGKLGSKLNSVRGVGSLEHSTSSAFDPGGESKIIPEAGLEEMYVWAIRQADPLATITGGKGIAARRIADESSTRYLINVCFGLNVHPFKYIHQIQSLSSLLANCPWRIQGPSDQFEHK